MEIGWHGEVNTFYMSASLQWRMPTSSAPGTLFLFGEHAVVYGEPAIPCAIERRTTVTVTRRPDDQIRIHSPSLQFKGATIEYGDDPPTADVPTNSLRHSIRYVDGAIDQVREITGVDHGFDIDIESELPMGAGLGSSAAVTVATLDAAARECDTVLDDAELAERAYQVEYEAQEGGASRAQTFCATMGGAIRIEGDKHDTIGAPDLPLVVGYDGGGADTGDLVANVGALRDEYEFVADTVTAIGDLVRRGESLLEAGDIEGVGQLMNINHGLLAALGVSSRSLDGLAWTARDAGAHGAKLTGAGGGGCVVAVDPTDRTASALEMQPECVAAFRADLASRGVRQE